MIKFPNHGVRSKGFKALLAAQFFGAFNDNAFKFVIATIAVDRYAHRPGGTLYVSLAGSALVLPFLLFSTYAGLLADRFSKQKVLIWATVSDLFVMTGGCVALFQGNIWSMLAVLFATGVQSAFLSPSKYGILPEILEERELSIGNGLIQMWTNIAIVLGTACGGALVHFTKPHIYKSSFVLMGVSLAAILMSFFITKVRPAGSLRTFKVNFLGELSQNIREIKKERTLFLAIIGLAYFGLLGALFQLNILLYSKRMMLVDDFLSSLLLVILALGIGAGGILAGKLSHEKVELGLVPLGATGLALFSLLLGFSYTSYLVVALSLFFLGTSAGLYIVPLNAFVQQKSPSDQRGKILATSNFLSFSAMLVGSGVLYLFRDLLHLNSAHIFLVMGCVTAAGASALWVKETKRANPPTQS